MSDPAWAYRWDDWHACDVCDFLEKLPHVEGEWATPTITLEPWQVFILTTTFGWRRKSDGYRRFNTVYFEVARKNAKSTIASGIGLYCLTCEGENGPQVLCGATTGKQARVVFKPANEMVTKTPDLRSEFQLEPLANSIVCYQNGGSMVPINAKASTQDGLNPHCTILDELHAHKDRSLFDVLKSARGARKNPISWYPTTAGYNLIGVCYEQRTFVTKVLQGIWDADHYFGIIYTLDEDDDPFDESVWIKANPNLGVSVQLEEMRGYAAEAELSPESEGEYKTKRQNIWLRSAGAWINIAKWDACAEPLSLDDFKGQQCFIGGDLAQLDDMAAVALLFMRGDILYIFVRYYLPLGVVEERAKAVPAYAQWAKPGGPLKMTTGEMIDYNVIEADIRGWCKQFRVRAIRMDQFGSAQITSSLAEDGFPAAILDKNAKNFTPAARDFETRVKHKLLRHEGSQPVKWNVSNAVVRRGVDDTLLPKKESADSPNKIDGLDAILQAESALVAMLPVKSKKRGPAKVWTPQGFKEMGGDAP